MSQKETLSRRRKANLSLILDCFSPFKQELRMKEITERTGLSRKVAWETLKYALDKIPLAKTAIRPVKKGVYRAVYPQFNELLKELGKEPKTFTIEEIIELFKEKDSLEFQGKQAILWLGFLPPFEDWRKEQDLLSHVRNSIYQASKKRNPNMLFKARQIFGYIIWEETEEEMKQRFLKRLEPLTTQQEGVKP
ncbi:MAG: hypothetical protein QXP36_03195 [Conexivisphaerales archaeon]